MQIVPVFVPVQTKKALTIVSQVPEIIGAEGQNRTADTGIFSPLLYRLSYLGFLKPFFGKPLTIKPLINCQEIFKFRACPTT